MSMRVLIRSADPVLLSYAESLLRDAGLSPQCFDSRISLVGGGIGALPQRLSVTDEEYTQARRLLSEAGLAHELVGDDMNRGAGL